MTEVSTLVALSKPSAVITEDCTASETSTTLTNVDSDDILIGMKVTGTHIKDGTIVTALNLGSNEITMSKEADGSGTTSITFTRTAYDTPTNPQLCVSALSPTSNGSLVDAFGVAVIEENSGNMTLTPVGRVQVTNCNATTGSARVTLSSGNTDSLYVGQEVTGTGFFTSSLPAGKAARIKRIISSTEFELTEKAVSNATNATYVLGIEHLNLEVTEGTRIKCFDDLTSTGIRLDSINLDTTHLFVMIHSDDVNKHHFAKVSEIFTDDISGDSFEFRPKLGDEIAKDVKFKLFSTPIPTDKTIAAVGLGIKNSIGHSVSLARPLFYFFNENLDKKNQLNHNKKYNLLYSELDFLAVSATQDSLSTKSFFSTMPDFGTDIIDYGKQTLKARLVDNLKTLDNPSTHTSNEGETLLTYTPFTSDACFTNARRDHNDTITDTASQDYNGPYRYLSYGFSKDKANLSYNIIDQILYESMGAKGTLAEVKVADPYRILSKKIGDEEPLRIRHQLFTGDFNEFKSIGATITSNPSGNTYATTTDHDLGSYLNVGDEVRVGTRIVVVQSIASISGKTQNITFRSENRLETESIFTTGSYTLANDSVLERRAYNPTDNTLLTDFPLVANRQTSLHVKLISKQFNFLYAGVSAIDVNKRLITLSFSNKGYFDSTTKNMLDYMKGQYAILAEKMTGEVERIDHYKENGLTQVKLAGRSNIRKLISPIISKNTLFSQDVIYSTQSPYNKLTSAGANFTCDFDSKTLTASTSITLSAGTQVHLKHASGVMSYIGEIASTVTGTGFTLVDKSRAEGTTLAGYKETNKNYMLNKALGTNPFVNSTTSLSGASNKGLFFNSGVKITSTGTEGDILVGSSGSDNENAIGYFISDITNIKSDSHFQGILEDENNNAESFDTVNTLIDFEVVKTESAGENKGTFVTVAPYVPLTLGRVDINYANTQDTTFHKDTLGKTLHDITNHARKYIDVDSDLALSAFNHIRGQKNLHNKPIYVGGKFLANIVSVEKSVEIFKSTTVDGTTAATVDTAGLSEGMVLSDNAHVNTKTIVSFSSTGIVLSSAAGGSSTADTLYSLPSTLARIYVDRDIGLVTIPCKLNSNTTLSNFDTTNIYAGMKVEGLDENGNVENTNIPASTTVVSIDSPTTITISNSANTSNEGVSIRFSFGSGTVIDRLEGHHNQDATRETSKLTHEFNLLNAGHLHGAKNIALIHPVLNLTNSYNPTSIVDYRLGGEQPNHRSTTDLSTNLLGTKLDEFGTYQSNFGASNYRLMNIEKGNYNKSKHLYFDGDAFRFYEEIPSKIKYYSSGYRYSAGYYTDGFLQNNIIGTDICGMNIVGQGEIGTTNGDSIIDATVAHLMSGATIHFDDIFRIGQKITGAGIPDDTFIGNIIGIGDETSSAIEARLTNLSATAVNATATATGVNAKFFEFDNKRLIESRGYLPSIGDKFYEPNTLETKSETLFEKSYYKEGGTPNMFYTPRPYTEVETSSINGGVPIRALHKFRDKFEQIDPKIARMFLFSNSDLLPYSSKRKDSLMNKDKERNIANYSLLTINEILTTEHSETKEAVKGRTTSITNLDDSYSNHNIVSARDDKKINQLKRFGIMRLTEIVVDCFYNQFDPENIPKRNKNIGTIGFYPKLEISNVQDSSGNHLSISSVSNKVINTVRADTGAAATADMSTKSVIVDKAGRFIGVVASVGSNAITLTANACKTDLATDSTGDFYAPRLNNQAGGSPNGEFMKLFKIGQAYFEQGNKVEVTGVLSNGSPTMTSVDTTDLFVGMRIEGSGISNAANASIIYRISSIDSATQLTMNHNASSPSAGTQTYTFTNYFGAGVITGYNTENNFVEVDGTVNPLQMATMRGLASDGTGYPNDYVRNLTTQSSGIGANRGDNDAGYGGGDANHTDITFFTRKGVRIAGQVVNKQEDCAMFLPFGFSGLQGYYSWLGRSFFNDLDYFSGNYHSDNPSIISKSIFPILAEYLHQATTAQHQTGTGNSIIQSNYSNSEGRGNANNRRMLQNHIPVFLDTWGITGGEGASADVGMTATKITNTRGIHVEGTSDSTREVRIGLALGTIWSGNNSLTTSGFASKTVSTDAVYADSNPTYDNDADGVFGGFKPTLKIDTGFNAVATFTTGGSTNARFEAVNSDILDEHGISGSAKMHLYVNRLHTDGHTDFSKLPKFTRTTEVNTGTTPDQVSMNANSLASGTGETVRFSRNLAGLDEKATNGTKVHTLVFPDFFIGEQANTMNAHWLSFVDLTGCYLVSEDVKRHLENTGAVENYETAGDYGLGGSHGLGTNIQALRESMDLGTPNHILYVISHEIDTTSPERKHILTVSGTFPSAASSRTASTRFRTFRVMQPNHTCFYDFSPKDIRINQMSSRYTKKPRANAMYETINHFLYKDQLGSHRDEGNNEGVLSMYVVVDPDGQTTEGNLVVTNPVNLRDNIMSTGEIKMNLSDGDNNNFTSVTFTDMGDDIGFEFNLADQKELLGVVSMSETIDLLINDENTEIGKRALIGSAVSVSQDADKLINEMLEENDIEFNITETSYPYFVAPNYKGVDLFSAIKFLMNKKNKILIEDNGTFTIEEEEGSNFFPNILFTTENSDTQIYTYSREKSMFDFYNEIIVFGKNHRAVRKELNSIKKKGKKTLQVFENELINQNDVDKRASELLKLHNDDTFGLKLNVGHKGISHLRVGDVVTVEIPQENITRSEFIVLEIQHNLAGTLDLELGSYTKGLEDRFAELAIGNRAVNNKIREGSFNDSQLNFDFLEKIKIKPIKFLARKKSVSAGGFTLGTSSDTSETLNTNTNALNIGTTTFTTLVEEEF